MQRHVTRLYVICVLLREITLVVTVALQIVQLILFCVQPDIILA